VSTDPAVGELILVRHASTDWSGRRYCGRTDVLLNAAGAAAADRLGSLLARESVPAVNVVTSPLRRARQTADAILAALSAATLQVDDRWAETDFGIAEGLTYGELEVVAPDVARQLAAGVFAVDWPDGEPASAFADRVLAGLDDVADDPLPTVVVTHGGPLRLAIAAILGQDPGRTAPPEPGELWRVPARRLATPRQTRTGDRRNSQSPAR